MSRSAIVGRAVKEALGFPSATLVAGMMGFGALVNESGMSLAIALGATAGIWGLPGQLAFVELYAAGSELIVIALAVSLANARFLPMSVAMLPLLQTGLRNRAWLAGLAHLMSLNSWAALLRVSGDYASSERRLYFSVFAGVCMTAALVGTTVGFFLTTQLPRSIVLGLVFLNPVFFALLFASLKGRSTAIALILGAVAGPLFHLVSADWGLLATGIVAGSVAFWVSRRKPAQEAQE